MQRNGNATINYNGLGTHALVMDKLQYNYNYDSNGNLKNNQLRSVQDAVVGTPISNSTAYNDNTEYATDIEDQTAGGTQLDNYKYDEIGNLIHDEKGEIKTIEWTLYGKIKKVTKTNGKTLTFAYDAAGNRIKKEVYYYDDPEIWSKSTTYYTRDAQGNVLAVYDHKEGPKEDEALVLSEVPLYGSSRLGEWRPRRLLDIVAQENTVTTASGEKTYELSNHLGNVLAVVSDALIDNAPSVVSATDYYAFGQEMVGRTFASEDYRYGFNGKENDREWGESLIQDYGMRLYNPALCRFLSVDPIARSFAMLTPYQFASNTPIMYIDIDGLEGGPAEAAAIFGGLALLEVAEALFVSTLATVAVWWTGENIREATKTKPDAAPMPYPGAAPAPTAPGNPTMGRPIARPKIEIKPQQKPTKPGRPLPITGTDTDTDDDEPKNATIEVLVWHNEVNGQGDAGHVVVGIKVDEQSETQYYHYKIVSGGGNLSVSDLKTKGAKARFSKVRAIVGTQDLTLTKQVTQKQAQSALDAANGKVLLTTSKEGQTYKINERNCATEIKPVLSAAGILSNDSKTVGGTVLTGPNALKNTMSGGSGESKDSYKHSGDKYRRVFEDEDINTFQFIKLK